MRATSVQSVVGGERTATCHVNVDRDACQASNLAGKRTFVTFQPLNFTFLRHCVHSRTWNGCISRIVNGFHCDMNIWETK